MQTEHLVDFLFTEQHSWILPRSGQGRVGITNYAQDEMKDFVFFELPDEGKTLERNEAFGVMESVKAVSDLYAPVTCKVVEVNRILEDRPELANEDPYGAGWMIRVEILRESEISQLANVVRYRAEVLGEVEHILYLDESNRIHYLPAVRGEDGRIIVDNESFESLLSISLIPAIKLRKLEVIEEFEYLINKPTLREQELQDFFERNPEFLLGVNYEKLFPQVVLREESQDNLIPDFILKPIAGVSYQPKIVELKLPIQKIVKPTRRREGLYANIYEAVSQLRAYGRYFEERENREYVRRVLGFTAYRPRLALIVGNSIELADERLKSDIIESIRPIELVTYNDILLQYKHLADLL